jgi:hypothetical protein
MGSFIAIPVGELAAGPLAMHFGSETVLTTSALVVILACIGAGLVPAIRRLESAPQVKASGSGLSS